MSDSSVDILIVGAGPTGLGAAWRLTELAARGRLPGGVSWCLVEAADAPGGLARSSTDALGFTWDYGGHVIYSHYAYFDVLYREILGPNVLEHPRRHWVYVDGRFVPFPIQHNFHLLGRDTAERIIDEVARRPPTSGSHANFREWLAERYGTTLSRLFFVPYNFKMWGVPVEELGVDWTSRKSGSRLANVPDLDPATMRDRLERGAPAPGWHGATPFPYPRTGGNGAFWAALASRLPASQVRYGSRLTAIDVERRLAYLGDGGTIRWRWMICTLPLHELVAMVEPREGGPMRHAVGRLRHSSVHFVGLGLRGEVPAALRDKHWISCVPESMPFFRATVLSNYSPANVPTAAPHWSLLFEVTSSPQRPVDAAGLAARCASAAATAGWIDVERIVATWQEYSAYGYPVPTPDREAILAAVQPILESHAILSRGRFGGWRYEASNQDNTFMQGLEAVDRLVFGAEEITYNHPELLNEGIVGRIIPRFHNE